MYVCVSPAMCAYVIGNTISKIAIVIQQHIITRFCTIIQKCYINYCN